MMMATKPITADERASWRSSPMGNRLAFRMRRDEMTMKMLQVVVRTQSPAVPKGMVMSCQREAQLKPCKA